jgi:uncharacterized membrane protein YqgA involved in biofilm formation
VRGLGTVINAIAIVIGGGFGAVAGHRLSERTRTTVTDALGLVVLVIGALNILAIRDDAFTEAVGADWTLLVVLGALLIGGIVGSSLRIEDRIESLGGYLRASLVRSETDDVDARTRFIDGFVSMSLLVCIGPLAILGSLSDGLGNGIDQLALKATLDGFAAVAFAATLGWGVAVAAVPLLVYQGLITAGGVVLGEFLAEASIAAITATGGVLLLAVGFRLMSIKPIATGDLLPALVVAPVLTAVVAAIRG